MRYQYSSKDWQNLNAYLDGQLTPAQREHFELKLHSSANLQQARLELQQTKDLLRKSTAIKSPHHFTLTAADVERLKPQHRFNWLPALSISSALATIMMIFTIFFEMVANPVPMSKSIAPASSEMLAAQAPSLAADNSTAPQESAPIIIWGMPGGVGSGGGGDASTLANGMGGGPAVKAADGTLGAGMGGAEVTPQPEILTLNEPPQAQEPITGAGPILGVRSPDDAEAYNQAVTSSLAEQQENLQNQNTADFSYLRWAQILLALVAIVTGGIALSMWRRLHL